MKNIVKVIEQDMINEYTAEEWYGEPVYEQEDATVKYEIIKNSESQTGHNIPDDIFYGDIGLTMGWEFEARNVSDKRFPVGKILYFSVTFINGMPEIEDEFMNFYAHDLGWELTGRVVFRGYYHEHYDIEDRDYYYTDATPEDIQMARERCEGWN